MGDFKVIPLPTEAEKQRQSVDTAVKALVEAHKRGEVQQLVVVYYDPSGGNHTWVSRSTTYANLSYAIHLLAHSLMEWLSE